MEEIKDFEYLYSDILKEHSNIFDRTPIAITWFFKGKMYKIENITDRLIADYSKCYNAIAVVEAPYSKAFNNVYIVNAENKLMINDFKKLLFNNIANDISNLCFVEGVICEGSTFLFHLIIRNNDFSISFDLATKTFGKLTEIRWLWYDINITFKYGNVYEITLSNEKYVYVYWIEQFSFGIFKYISEESLTDISCLLTLLLLKMF